MNLNDIGQHIAQARKRQKLTQSSLATQLGMSRATLSGIETADVVLIVGSHVRWEAPLVNSRLRKAAKAGAKFFVVGPEWETTFPATFLGSDLSVLDKLPADVTEAFKAADKDSDGNDQDIFDYWSNISKHILSGKEAMNLL